MSEFGRLNGMQILGQCLDAELSDRGLTSPGAQICGDIVQGVLRRYGEAVNRRQLAAAECEELTRRSV
ncbi:hypothetical protein [Bradyrhizobium elkanii]|uniref:hypothetical protein n=1 Tax=Bradyrhizobium elkanii TaxID=29448 RepID=UPI003D21057E